MYVCGGGGVHVLANVGVWRVQMTMCADACGGHRLTRGVFSDRLHSAVLELQVSRLEVPAEVLSLGEQALHPPGPPLQPWVLFLSRTFTVLQRASLIIMPFIFYKYPCTERTGIEPIL